VRSAARTTSTSGLIDVEDVDAALVHVVQVCVCELVGHP
jgi:hypothetical protein